jgi:hypothetical protein
MREKMKIELKEIAIRDLVVAYTNDETLGVSAFNGKLDIRPAYQRNFVYNPEQRNRVIDTVQKDFPLNVMYWAKHDLHTAITPRPFAYDVLDGQQRTISICDYHNGDFSVDGKFFYNLTSDEKKQFLDYKLMVYICEGSESEKLAWFRIINIAGAKLTEQELRNSVFTGAWLSSAKKYFSKVHGPAHSIGGGYLDGSANRQEYLETAISWIATKSSIDNYMAAHQCDADATALWTHFEAVINWVQLTFPKYRKAMQGLDWGTLYEAYKTKVLDPAALEIKIRALLIDDDVTRKAGIYAYLLSGDEKHLSVRAFPDHMKETAIAAQGGKCPGAKCTSLGKPFNLSEMEADHITPWSLGGKTLAANCQMLCKECNRRKSNT